MLTAEHTTSCSAACLTVAIPGGLLHLHTQLCDVLLRWGESSPSLFVLSSLAKHILRLFRPAEQLSSCILCLSGVIVYFLLSHKKQKHFV